MTSSPRSPGRVPMSRSTLVTGWPRWARNRLCRPRPAATSRTAAPGEIRPAHCTTHEEGKPLASGTFTPHHLALPSRECQPSESSCNFMILYRLRCSKGHEFESWFKDSKTYERQEKKSLIGCAVCGEAKVERALMAPRLGKGSGKKDSSPVEVEMPAAATPAAPPAPSPEQQQMAALARHMPKELREALLKVRAEVEKNCEHVGDKFADEARKIHYGESDKRGIYGETSEEEAEALAEEGIEFGRLPWIPRGN